MIIDSPWQTVRQICETLRFPFREEASWVNMHILVYCLIKIYNVNSEILLIDELKPRENDISFIKITLKRKARKNPILS